MQDIIQTEPHVKPRCLIFEVSGGIPSSRVAAAIKFGLEALPGVDAVHFVEHAVQVVTASDGVLVEHLWETLIHVGLPEGGIILRSETPHDC